MGTLLVYDLGTTGLKTAVFSEDFRLLGSAGADYPTHRPASGRAEQAPGDWWNALVSTTHELFPAHPEWAQDLKGISVTGHMMGCIPVARDGAVLMDRVPIWSDDRGAGQCAEFLGRMGGFERFYDIARQGIQTELYSLAKIMWIRDALPEVFEKARWFANAKDILGFHLTGRIATDPSELACTIAYDVRERRMSPDILDAAGLDAGFAPEALAPGSLIDNLTAKAGQELGLPAGVPVFMGLGDAVAASVGALACQPGDAYFSFGTAMWGGVIAVHPQGDPVNRVNVLPYATSDLYQLQYVVNTGMLAHDWAVETFYSKGAFAQAEAEAARVAPDSANLFFLPTLTGSSAPFNRANARGVFFGASPRHGPAHFVRATLEGLALTVGLVRRNLEALGRGEPITRVSAIGGGTVSPFFLQTVADILQCDVELGAFEKDCTAFGAAICAAMGAGIIDRPEDARAMVPQRTLYRPDPARATESAMRSDLFEKLFERLGPSFDDLAAFRQREGQR